METGKAIDLLNTRDPIEVQKKLDKYENLNIISRDRGYSYKSVSEHCTHIADRFHLIMNLSDAIIKEIKRTLPTQIILKTKIENIESKPSEENTKEYTSKQIEKQKIILKLKEEYANGKSMRKLAEEYKLDRKTISKYIQSVDIEKVSVYDVSNRNFSYLDNYKSEIIELYNITRNISEVYRKLESKIANLKYSTLRHYISKIKKDNQENNNQKKGSIVKVSRSQIIRYILNWEYKEEVVEDISKALEEYPVLKKYKYFYQRFKEYLTNLNVLCLLNLLNSNHEEECINKYILSLKKDWEAVINAASIGLSNGVTEGNVNKIKQIKRDMYGRASYELLRKKVIYQSLFS